MALLRSATALVAGLSLVAAQGTTVLNLLSRQDIRAPQLDVLEINDDLNTPGYIFFTPNSPEGTNFQYGPYIYNNQGKLVYSGYKLLTAGYDAFDAQVVRHDGEDMLAFTQFTGPRGGGPAEHGSYSEVFDRSYKSKVRVFPTGNVLGQQLTHDLHEFNVIGDRGDTALITSYVTVERNITLPHCPGKPTIQFVKDGVMSEVATDGSNKVLFNINFLDLIDPTETFVCPGQFLVSHGKGPHDGFDYLHLNSIDKDEYGDYLLSCRHMNAVYKIAGNSNPEGYAPATIIWQLGGRSNGFPVMASDVPTAQGLNFTFQHHVRWAPEIDGITLFNNANNGIIGPSASASSGMDIRIGKGTATLVGHWMTPDHELDSSQGSHQLLASGNHFLGMGSFPSIYEVTPEGETAFYAKFGPLPLQSYRSFKFNWTGTPPEHEIGFFGYSQYCEGDAAYYASWNGATEVASWKFYTNTEEHGDYTQIAHKAVTETFETHAVAPFNLWAYAEAYDASGNLMGTSKKHRTWTPVADEAPDCGPHACPGGTDYDRPGKVDCPAPVPEDAYPSPTEDADLTSPEDEINDVDPITDGGSFGDDSEYLKTIPVDDNATDGGDGLFGDGSETNQDNDADADADADTDATDGDSNSDSDGLFSNDDGDVGAHPATPTTMLQVKRAAATAAPQTQWTRRSIVRPGRMFF